MGLRSLARLCYDVIKWGWARRTLNNLINLSVVQPHNKNYEKKYQSSDEKVLQRVREEVGGGARKENHSDTKPSEIKGRKK